MPIKLLALDMDGTTLKDDHTTLSPANRTAIEAVIAAGIEVVVATGRTFARMPKPMLDIPGLHYALIANGAAVIELPSGRALYENPLPKDAIARTLDAVAPFALYLEGYAFGKPHIDARDAKRLPNFPIPAGRLAMIRSSSVVVPDLRAFLLDEQTTVEKLNFPYISTDCYERVWQVLEAVPEVALTTSVSQNAEINSATASKADGLQNLCRLLGIAPEGVMAIGDGGNDLSMLRFAGIGVAMGNATEVVKAAADYITDTNEQDGVARAIERFLI